MPDNDKAAFLILWCEDQLREIEDGVAELERRLKEELSQEIARAEALTVEAAERELSKRGKRPPDLILLDIILPLDENARGATPPEVDLNAGFFIWDRIRHREWGKGIAQTPILVVTARGNPEFRAAMVADQNLAWLEKPVPPSEMAQAILKLCGRDRQ